MALDRLGFPAHEVMMVASHKYDLEAAQNLGFLTALTPRPLERGPGGTTDQPAPGDTFTLTAMDFNDLASKLDS